MKEWRRAFNNWIKTVAAGTDHLYHPSAFKAGFHAGVLSQTEAKSESKPVVVPTTVAPATASSHSRRAPETP